MVTLKDKLWRAKTVREAAVIRYARVFEKRGMHKTYMAINFIQKE